MTDIKGSFPISPLSSTPSTAHRAFGLINLRPSTSLETLLASISIPTKATVIETRPNTQPAGQTTFNTLLNLSLANGQQISVRVQSPIPLLLGAQYQLSLSSDQQSLQAQLVAQEAPLEHLDPETWPPGTVLQGRVTATQQLSAEARTTQHLVKLIHSPSAQTLIVESESPLSIGTLISAQVKNPQALQWLPLNQQLNQIRLEQQLKTQFNQQASLQTLVDHLQEALLSLPKLRPLIEQWLALLPEVAQLTRPQSLAQSLRNSGLLLENQLLAAITDDLPDDLKAGLLRLLQHLKAQDSLLPTLPTALPQSSSGSTSAAVPLPQQAQQLIKQLSMDNAQVALNFPLTRTTYRVNPTQGKLEQLIGLLTAAIARLQTHQLASLAQNQTDERGQQTTTWQLELPVRLDTEISVLQIRLQAYITPEEHSPKPEKPNPMSIRWQIDLAFDWPSLGPLQVQTVVQPTGVSSQFWAERATTAQIIQQELGYLREQLQAAGLSVTTLNCYQGVSPARKTHTAVAAYFVDEQA